MGVIEVMVVKEAMVVAVVAMVVTVVMEAEIEAMAVVRGAMVEAAATQTGVEATQVVVEEEDTETTGWCFNFYLIAKLILLDPSGFHVTCSRKHLTENFVITKGEYNLIAIIKKNFCLQEPGWL